MLLSACGTELNAVAQAASMFLRRTEGTVGGVDTEAESYAWIDPDVPGQTGERTEYNEDGSERRAESHVVEESGEERIQRVGVELLDENGNLMQNTICYPDYGGNRELRVSSIASYTYDEDGYSLGYTYCEYYPDGPITGSMVAEYERVDSMRLN